jgi:hypothetical protein
VWWSWHGDPWANAALFPWQKSDLHQRSAPSLSSWRNAHLASLLMLMHNLSCFTDEYRPLWHNCSYSPRDYAQVPDNWLVFVDYLLISNDLLALNSGLCNNFKIRHFLRVNEVLLRHFFFLTLDGFLISAVKTVSFSYFANLLKNVSAAVVWKFFSENWR